MKKLLAVFLSLFLLLGLASCGVKGEDVVLKTASDGTRTSINFSAPLSIPQPDKILYYHQGKKVAFERGSKEFEEIFILNQARCPEYMGDQYQTFIPDWNVCFQKLDILEYWYNAQYHPIFFNLTIDENMGGGYGCYWAATLEGQQLPLRGGTGFPLNKTDLLAYLNSLK